MSALLIAVWNKNHSEIKFLIAEKADVNLADHVCVISCYFGYNFEPYSLHLAWQNCPNDSS